MRVGLPRNEDGLRRYHCWNMIFSLFRNVLSSIDHICLDSLAYICTWVMLECFTLWNGWSRNLANFLSAKNLASSTPRWAETEYRWCFLWCQQDWWLGFCDSGSWRKWCVSRSRENWICAWCVECRSRSLPKQIMGFRILLLRQFFFSLVSADYDGPWWGGGGVRQIKAMIHVDCAHEIARLGVNWDPGQMSVWADPLPEPVKLLVVHDRTEPMS